MTDSFGASIEGNRDWLLPYSGKRKGTSTIRQYTRSAEQLAAWAREQVRQGFGELTGADLRAFLNTRHRGVAAVVAPALGADHPCGHILTVSVLFPAPGRGLACPGAGPGKAVRVLR